MPVDPHVHTFICDCGQVLAVTIRRDNARDTPIFWYGLDIVEQCPGCYQPLYYIWYGRPWDNRWAPAPRQESSRPAAGACCSPAPDHLLSPPGRRDLPGDPAGPHIVRADMLSVICADCNLSCPYCPL